MNTIRGRASVRPQGFKSLVLAGAVSSLLAAPTKAQLVLEEVIVTAQKRAESLQDVPISVQAMTGHAMQDAGIQRIEQLANYVPNFNMTETAVGNQIFMRGVGSGIN